MLSFNITEGKVCLKALSFPVCWHQIFSIIRYSDGDVGTCPPRLRPSPADRRQRHVYINTARRGRPRTALCRVRLQIVHTVLSRAIKGSAASSAGASEGEPCSAATAELVFSLSDLNSFTGGSAQTERLTGRAACEDGPNWPLKGT